MLLANIIKSPEDVHKEKMRAAAKRQQREAAVAARQKMKEAAKLSKKGDSKSMTGGNEFVSSTKDSDHGSMRSWPWKKEKSENVKSATADVHPGVKCAECGMNGIKGARYVCIACPRHESLCVRCYYEGTHDKSHVFHKIERVGSSPCPLRPLEEPPIAPPISTTPFPPSGSVGSAPFEYNHELLYMTPMMPPAVISVPVVEKDYGSNSSVASTSDLEVGQIVRLRGLSKVAMNGQYGFIETMLPGGKLVVRMQGMAAPVVVNVKNCEEAFPLNTAVVLPTGGVGLVVSAPGPSCKIYVSSDAGVITEWEPEQLSIIDELE